MFLRLVFLFLLASHSIVCLAENMIEVDSSQRDQTQEKPSRASTSKLFSAKILSNCNAQGTGDTRVEVCLPEKSTPTLNPAAAGAVLAIYAGAGFVTYEWWYKDREKVPFQTLDEGWFGKETYAGGTDKLAHLWGNYAFTRTASGILEASGMSKLPASVMAGTLTLLFFTGTEYKDGRHKGYGWSWGDMIMNITGNLLAVAMINVPKLDQMFDYRLEYLPSAAYIRRLKGSEENLGEDYTGMYFALWYHLSSLQQIADSPNPVIRTLKYFDLGVGYHTEGFKPNPGADEPKFREPYFGISANLQQVTDDLFYKGEKKEISRSALQRFTELFTIPYTAVHLGPKYNAPLSIEK